MLKKEKNLLFRYHIFAGHPVNANFSYKKKSDSLNSSCKYIRLTDVMYVNHNFFLKWFDYINEIHDMALEVIVCTSF